jgi:glyoxylate reductase
VEKPKVFVTRIIRDKGLIPIKEFCQADIWPEELPPNREELLERVRGIDGLLCLLTDRIDAEVMDSAGPGLKVISNHAVGFDNIDIEVATARGIPVGNTPGILTDATADMAFALLLSAARRVVEAEKYLHAGNWKTWSPSVLLGLDVRGATLGIVGFGRIGQALAKRATGFDMRVLYYDPKAQSTEKDPSPKTNLPAISTDLESLLLESDFISLHVPLTPATHHLVDAEFLGRLKPDAVLINTSRGGVVDQEALFLALKDRRLFAAALDVTDPEPLPLDSPLLELDNCIVLPHIASATYQSRDMMAYLAAQNLNLGVQSKRLQNCVNPEVYGKKSGGQGK